MRHTQRRARVLFVTHTAEWIGPNVSLLELVTRLPVQLEPLVGVLGSGRFTAALTDTGMPFVQLDRLDKWGIPALVRIIRRQEVSLVYGNSAHGASRNALVAAKLCGVPFVYHLREMAPSGGERRTRLYSRADAAIAVSKATAASYGGRFREPPRVVYNGVSVERFRPDRTSCRERVLGELGLPGTARIILHAGNVYARKDQLTAVQALREVTDRVPDACLLLAGRLDRDPGYVQQVRDRIVESGLSGRAILTGLREDMEIVMGASDVFLHTATADPHPRAVIEAMASALPVVALAVDGVAESVVDGATGYLVSPPPDASRLAQPLIRLLEDPELGGRMGEAGRERARREFSAEATASQISDLLLDILGRR